jgi:ABC-type nitrate/sulfonate/bicarbonate transport system permease component
MSRPWPWRGAFLPLALLVLLELALRIADLRSDSVARPSEVLRALIAGLLDASVLRDTVQTLGCALGGLLIGAAAGLVLGALLGLSRIAAGLAWASVESMRHLPPVALLPIATLVFGLGVRMEVSVVAFTCFWPMLLLTQAAVAGVEPRLLEVARTLRMGSVATIVKIVLPASAARVAVALRLSAGIALIVAVTTEIAANPLGIGYAMVRSQAELQPAPMYAYLLWLALLGWTLNEAMARLERRLTRALGAAGRP